VKEEYASLIKAMMPSVKKTLWGDDADGDGAKEKRTARDFSRHSPSE
jgi:hypothetical protein